MRREEPAAEAVEAEREPNFLLSGPERRVLPWMARRLPRWVLPDDMTALGVAAAFGGCVAYQHRPPPPLAAAAAHGGGASYPEIRAITRPTPAGRAE
jgi:hypothetical protein